MTRSIAASPKCPPAIPEVAMQNVQPTDKRQLLLDRMLKDTSAKAATAAIPHRDPIEPVPLSFGQERMWFLDQLAPGNPFYAETAGLVVHTPIDLGALQRAI